MDNNRTNQLNPNNSSFWKSRGYSDRPSSWMSILGSVLRIATTLTQADLNNHSNQLNPNNSVFWSSRGQSKP